MLRQLDISGDRISLTEYLEHLRDQRFWGSILLKYEGGEVVHIR